MGYELVDALHQVCMPLGFKNKRQVIAFVSKDLSALRRDRAPNKREKGKTSVRDRFDFPCHVCMNCKVYMVGVERACHQNKAL